MESSSSCWDCCKLRVTCQIYCGQQTDVTGYIIDELSHKLTQELSRLGILLEIELCDSPFDIERSIPLIVICQQCTRLGSDYNSAVQDIPDGGYVAVLICHHKDLNSLPKESSKNILRDTEYKKVEAIIDTAFTAQSGWYNCNMNTMAYQLLNTFFRAHPSSHRSCTIL